MIEVVVVAPDGEITAGLRRLIENNGDMHVVESVPTLPDLQRVFDGHHSADPLVVVIGPGVDPPADWWRGIGDGDRHIVVMSAVPGRDGLPDGVVEAAMELTGRSLRAAVRKSGTNGVEA